ncbi:zinc finger, CCHC-type containing protein [Tanacetum coccineum]
MAVAAIKHMALNFVKLNKFKGVDFRRWQNKMHFLLSSKSVLYVFTTPIHEDGENATVEQIRRRNKWAQCHQSIEESLRMQDNDKPKGKNVVSPLVVNMDDDVEWWVNSRANVHVYKDRCWLKTYESLNDGSILHKRNESTTLLNIVNDNIASAFMSTSKLNDSILWHARLGHVHFKRMQDMSKDGLIPVFDMDTEKWNKKYIMTFIDDASREVVRLPDSKLKTLGKRGIECIFVRYVEHFKAFRFYVIEPNELISINSIIESKDNIFDENRLSSVLRPSLMILNETEDIGGSVVLEEVTEEVVTQHPEPEARKGKRIRTPKNFGLEFQLYLIKGTRGEVSDQQSYYFNVKDDPKTFDEAIKSQDVAFWKEAINDEMDSIMRNNTLVLADLPPGCKPLGCKWIFKRKLNVDGTIEKFSKKDCTIRLLIAMASIHNLIIHQMDVNTSFLNGKLNDESHYIEKVLKKFNYFDCTPVSTPMDTSKKLMPNNGQTVSQLEYSRVIGCLMYVMTCTRPDIAFAVGKLSSLTYTGYPSDLEGYTDASWICNTEDNSSTSGWVFLLGKAVISWVSKKQTCITSSTMEYEFVALSVVGKEAEWLRNLILEIPLWSKPIAPISIRCDSAATLAKAYSQMYNGKSRHLEVRHSMIRELIMNEVVSIEFVRSQQNLADHLMKGLARDLVLKSAEGMGLNGVECMYLHIIPRMCLEPAEKEDEVFASQRSLMKFRSNPSEDVSLAGMLLSGLANKCLGNGRNISLE